MVVILSR